MRACARTRTRACAAIFVQIGAENFSEMCVRVSAYITCKVPTCAHTSACPFLAKKNFLYLFLEKNPFLARKKKIQIFFPEKCAGACARAGAKTEVRVRACGGTKMCAMCVRVRTKIRAH